MGFFNKPQKETIAVTFIDVQSGKTLFKGDIPPGQLPDSFEASTTFHLPSGDWKVERAEPITSAEFIKSGALVVYIHKIETMSVDPAKLLFSLPTISDVVGQIEAGSTKLNKRTLELDEDSWGQIEFVSASKLATIKREFASIEQIFRQESEGRGFKKLHVREEIKQPLDGAITLAQIDQLFAHKNFSYEGISYQNVAGVIENGFAFNIDGLFDLYGQHKENVVETLGLIRTRKQTEAIWQEKTSEAIWQLLKGYDLYLIDWCNIKLIDANILKIKEYLAQAFG